MTYCSVVAVLALVGLTEKRFDQYAILKILPFGSLSYAKSSYAKNTPGTLLYSDFFFPDRKVHFELGTQSKRGNLTR